MKRTEASSIHSLSEMGVRYSHTVCVHVCDQLKGILSDTKSQLSSEILKRVDMENQVQTLEEQLEFQRNMSEQVTYRHTDKVSALAQIDTKNLALMFAGDLGDPKPS